MKAEIKSRWVEALRSGEYEQGTEYLKREESSDKIISYCCLGVLCEINNIRFTLTKEEDGDVLYGVGIHSEYSFSTRNILKRLGLSAHFADDLANMNDSGVSFDSIADYIQIRL